jgi:NADPH-dependent 2,4-dienoyl-CoA reductase/sulfur reductase-like enzyme
MERLGRFYLLQNKIESCYILAYIMNLTIIAVLLCLGVALEQVHEVIIIGAGLAAASASRVLTDRGVPHLMLEARNRTGGRITNASFDGLTVDLGAGYVHKPNNSNPIVKMMKELNWTAFPAR